MNQNLLKQINIAMKHCIVSHIFNIFSNILKTHSVLILVFRMAQHFYTSLYTARTLLLLLFHKELNALKFSATMVSVNILKGITLHFSKNGSSSFNLYFIAAWAPKWLI